MNSEQSLGDEGSLHSPFNSNIFRLIENGPFGKAKLASKAELVSLAERASEDSEKYIRLLEGFGIGHDSGLSLVEFDQLPIPLGNDSPNLLVTGRSGSGKTQKVILPAAIHAILAGWSLVFINNKGRNQTELLRQTAITCERTSEFTLLSPLYQLRSQGWTSLESCRTLQDAGAIATAMVAASAGKARHERGAWTYNGAEGWLQHAIAAVCSDPHTQPTLKKIRDVVIAGRYREFADEYPKFPKLHEFANYWKNNTNGVQIAATICEATRFIDDVQGCLSRSDLRLDQFAKQGGILVLEVDEHSVGQLREFITLFLDCLLNELQKRASEVGRLPKKTVIIVDELDAAGNLSRLSQVLHTCRERNFGFVAGVQSIAQLRSRYGKDSESLLAGFQSHVVLGRGLDLESAEYFSRMSGKATLAIPTNLEAAAAGAAWHMISRNLLLPGDIQVNYSNPHWGTPATVFLANGINPFQCYLTPAHQNGSIYRTMQSVERSSCSESLRSKGQKVNRQITPSQIQIAELRSQAGWKETTTAARAWWIRVETTMKDRPNEICRILRALVERKASISDLFLAFLYSGSDSLQTNLDYLDKLT